MLYNTRIHHLHINNTIENNGFVRRGDLLFCVILPETVYFLDIKGHLNGDKQWCAEMQENLMQIIDDNKNNYDDLKNAYKFIINEHYTISPQDRFSFQEDVQTGIIENPFMLNRSGINHLFSLNNGKTIIPYKMIRSDGSIGEVCIRNFIGKLQEDLKNPETIKEVRKKIEKVKKQFYKKYFFKIIRRNKKWILTDPYKKVDFREICSKENSYGIFHYFLK